MYILVLLIIVFVLSIIYIYNKFITLLNNIKKSKSIIDVYLQQRFDLIPNLIKVTKKYINYEKELLDRITQLRTLYNKTKDIKVSNELNIEYQTIIAIAENYPELKSSEQFFKLQKALIKIESQLQAARRIYNNDVTKYNIKISTFPNNLIAKIFNFTNAELFILDGEDKINIKF